MGPDAWRIMFRLGILPAFVARGSASGSLTGDVGSDGSEGRAGRPAKSGAVLAAHGTLVISPSLNCSPTLRPKVTIVVFLMSPTTTLAWWGISIGSLHRLGRQGALTAQQWASCAAMAYIACPFWIRVRVLADASAALVVIVLRHVLVQCHPVPVDHDLTLLLSSPSTAISPRPIFVDAGVCQSCSRRASAPPAWRCRSTHPPSPSRTRRYHDSAGGLAMPRRSCPDLHPVGRAWFLPETNRRPLPTIQLSRRRYNCRDGNRHERCRHGVETDVLMV